MTHLLAPCLHALSRAEAANESPRCWNMTKAAYLHLYATNAWYEAVREAKVGAFGPQLFLGYPVSVVDGAEQRWELYCESGRIYGEGGVR